MNLTTIEDYEYCWRKHRGDVRLESGRILAITVHRIPAHWGRRYVYRFGISKDGSNDGRKPDTRILCVSEPFSSLKRSREVQFHFSREVDLWSQLQSPF